MDKDTSAIKLREQADFFENEYNRLKTELILESNPTNRFQIQQNLEEALRQKDIAEKLLTIASGNVSQGAKDSDSQSEISSIDHNNTIEMKTLDVFVSHSSSDESVAEQLVVFIKSALNLQSEKIRCTSVNGYRLPAGISTNERLQKEIHESNALIALITPNSLRSMYVLFELGARWVTKKPLIPLLACGVTNSDLREPLSAFNALTCYEPAQLHQLIRDLGEILKIPAENAAAYQNNLNSLMINAQKAATPNPVDNKETIHNYEKANLNNKDHQSNNGDLSEDEKLNNILELLYRHEKLSIWAVSKHLEIEYSLAKYRLEKLDEKKMIRKVQVKPETGEPQGYMLTGYQIDQKGVVHLSEKGLIHI